MDERQLAERTERLRLPALDWDRRLDPLRAVGNRWLTPIRRKAIRDGFSLVGVLGVAYLFVQATLQGGGADTPAFWGMDFSHLYGNLQWLQNGAHIYSPAFYQLIAPLSLFSYHVFVAAWAAIALAALVWMVRPGPWLGVAVLWVGVVGEIQGGNIHMLMAAAIVASFRYPEAWSLLLLTKVIPGMGVLWFPLRREWRNFARALAGTAVVVLVSGVIAPGLWMDWVQLLVNLAHYGSGAATTTFFLPLDARIVLALGVLVWGVRTDRRWTVPVVAVLASPLMNVAPSMLVACIPLARRERSRERGTGMIAPLGPAPF